MQPLTEPLAIRERDDDNLLQLPSYVSCSLHIHYQILEQTSEQILRIESLTNKLLSEHKEARPDNLSSDHVT